MMQLIAIYTLSASRFWDEPDGTPRIVTRKVYAEPYSPNHDYNADPHPKDFQFQCVETDGRSENTVGGEFIDFAVAMTAMLVGVERGTSADIVTLSPAGVEWLVRFFGKADNAFRREWEEAGSRH